MDTLAPEAAAMHQPCPLNTCSDDFSTAATHPDLSPSRLIPFTPSISLYSRCVPSPWSWEALCILLQGGLLVSRTMLTEVVSSLEGTVGRHIMNAVSVPSTLRSNGNALLQGLRCRSPPIALLEALQSQHSQSRFPGRCCRRCPP